MPVLRFERVSFAYADHVPILDAVELRLEPGWTAVVGENGAGKSTLLALACGALAPASGRVRVAPEPARIVLCPQRVDAAGPAEAALAADEGGEARRLRAELGLEPDGLSRWASLSPGERRRWQLGGALLAGPDVLLLDEPTNHADAAARAHLVAALRRFRGVGLVVTHDRALMAALDARTLRVGGGEARLFALGYDAARAAWEGEAAAVRARRDAAQGEAAKAARRLADARRAHAGAERSRSGRHRDPRDHDARGMGPSTLRGWAEDRLGRDVGRLRAAAERAREAIPEVAPDEGLGRSVFVGFARAPRPVLLALDAAEVCAPGGPPVLRDVHVRLRREDRIWVEGPNGAGKSTLLAALLAAAPAGGEGLLVLPQELPAAEGRRLLAEARALPAEVRGRVLSLLAALGSDPGRLLASADPSPGEARKLLLALGLGRHAFGLVLDEPTNHLDLPTVERLEAALAAYPGAILLVSHDRAFAERCTASRWRVASGRVEATSGAGGADAGR